MAAKRCIAAEDASNGDYQADGEIQDSLQVTNGSQGLRVETYAGLCAMKSATDKPAEPSFMRKAGASFWPNRMA
jgi:hypothetical protein